MLAFGIFLGIITAILKSADTMFNKSLMNDVSAVRHSVYRIIFVIPYLFLAAVIHWNFQTASIFLLIIYSLCETVNILFHQLAIKTLNPVHVEIISKSKSVLTYIISLILTIESVSLTGVAGIMVFFIGILLTIDYKTLNPKLFSDWKGYVFEIISVLSRTIKPFILRKLLIENSISNEALTFLSMVISLIIICLIFRPKITFSDINVKKYTIQALIVSVSMILSGYTILYAGAVLSSMLENCSIVFVTIMMFLLYKKKTKPRLWLGIILIIIGAWLNTAPWHI